MVTTFIYLSLFITLQPFAVGILQPGLPTSHEYLIAFPAQITAQTIHAKGFAQLVYHSKFSLEYQRLPHLTRAQLAKLHRSIELPPKGFGFFADAYNSLASGIEADFKLVGFSGNGTGGLMISKSTYAEEPTTFLWLKKGSSYRFCCSISGTPDLLIRNSRELPYSIVAVTGYCCAGYIGDYTLYSPTTVANRLTYVHQQIIRRFGDLQIPTTSISPRKFLILDSLATLRSSPRLQDELDTLESHIEGRTVFGNIIAQVGIGEQGLALAEQTDSTGTRWILAIFDSEVRLERSRFYNGPYGSIAAWLKRDSVKFKR